MSAATVIIIINGGKKVQADVEKVTAMALAFEKALNKALTDENAKPQDD